MVLGIKFAPLDVPWERRMQTLALAQWVATFLFIGPGCLVLTIYMILFTRLWWAALLYVAYMWHDRATFRRGGRRMQWARKWAVWRYFAAYFPAKLTKTCELDPRKNYLVGYHPHGVLAAGSFLHFATEGSGFSSIFPGIRPVLLVLPGHFQFPFYRDYFGFTGACEASKESIDWLLSKEGTGNAVCLVLGGALEALDAHPDTYRLHCRSKKGFVKIALRRGASLLPVMSFGENNIYKQVPNETGSRVRRFQDFLTKYTGFSPPLFYARGIFQYSFGLVPFRTPINTVVGAPLDLPTIEAPSPAEVEVWHGKYLDAANQLFEDHKLKYGVPASQHLEMV